MKEAPETNWGPGELNSSPHLGNYTLTPGDKSNAERSAQPFLFLSTVKVNLVLRRERRGDESKLRHLLNSTLTAVQKSYTFSSSTLKVNQISSS